MASVFGAEQIKVKAQGNVPRYKKQPALIAPRTLLAVSDEVATDTPMMTPTKLVQATAFFRKDA